MLAYNGCEFTIEWFMDEKGESKAFSYYCELPYEQKRKLLNLFRLMGDHGKIFDKTKFRHEGDGIFAFKPKPDRFLCFFCDGKKIIVTNAFLKKSDKLPKGQKDLALQTRANYQARVKKGEYYEKK